ncbi:60S ribosomal subunit assembly or modification protein [Coemansia sp. RSA 1813]|nr:60S ribosomal subunit assembly or modification protein [Coemansia sp. RSA 1646]KAJ1769408.1 60S ribosomal subunit assembly or modification protein [Coemansia sp. RSA 1843]KAJ2087979.1 60S ribosomal subunit assembly or modification protein [Coemansia sp. RSA 986]KAJ2211325.1 60S ribosomal subunit assembly or modification protein [Coemansia sp. RSA 487]KAJ2567817.1 60S ribosomal subunit assembly or modification protein [Coemansia sp. RSA 1813]
MSANNGDDSMQPQQPQQRLEEHEHEHEEYDEQEETYIEPEEVADVVADEDDAAGHEPMDDDDEEEEEEEEGKEGTSADGPEDEVLLEDDSVQGFFTHEKSVFSVDLSPTQPNIAVSGGEDEKAYVWRTDNGELVAELDKHQDSVSAVQFSKDGSLVAAAGMDGKINVYKTTDFSKCATLEGPDEVQWVEWHPKGNVLLAGGSGDGSMWMWSLPNGDFMNVFNGHSVPVTCGRFTNNGRNIVSGAEDGSLIIWDPKTASVVRRFSPDDERFHQDGITTLALSKDDQVVLTGSMDGTARLVHFNNGTILGSLDNAAESVEAVGLCSVLPLAATGSVDGTLSIWDISTMRLRTTLKHEDSVTRLQWHQESPLLTSVSVDGTVRTWDARTGECVHMWKGHQDAILDFSMTPDGKIVVTASDDTCCLVFAP